ncbi:MAG: hypothetical protein RSC10_03990 [Longicatena sp.]
MKKYIELKIMKMHILLFGIILAVVCSAGVYYVWCSYHPEIHIEVAEGGSGENKIETPSVTVGYRTGIKTAKSVELDILNFWIQYNHMNEYVYDNYKKSDIKLNIEVKNNKTVLKYSGTATTLNDEVIDFDREIVCELVLDADIIN